MGCVVNQIAAIEEWNNLYTFGKDVVIQFAHLGFNASERRIRVRALLQQRDAIDYVRVINELPVHTMDGSAILSEPDLGPLLDDGDVFHAQCRPGLRLDQGILNLLNIGEEADSLHIDLLRAGNDKAPTGISIMFA